MVASEDGSEVIRMADTSCSTTGITRTFGPVDGPMAARARAGEVPALGVPLTH